MGKFVCKCKQDYYHIKRLSIKDKYRKACSLNIYFGRAQQNKHQFILINALYKTTAL